MTAEAPTPSWESVAPDPDPARDLGFDGIELDVIRQSDGERAHVLVIPRDDAMLREEAFIIAEPGALVELESHR